MPTPVRITRFQAASILGVLGIKVEDIGKQNLSASPGFVQSASFVQALDKTRRVLHHF